MYNENEPFAIRWLEQLQERNLIPGGKIDGRSITELRPEDCGPTSHFFAGIGGWAYALQLAGWDPARDVWSGSCPCQSLSSAGRKRGANDKRHLWPIWYELIKECRPPTIFGEQVASSLGRQWFAGVRADLEALGYAVGSADLCAASLGAPHIRSRLYWVADSAGMGRNGEVIYDGRQGNGGTEADERRNDSRMAHSNDSGRQPGHGEEGGAGREVRLRSSVESGNRSAACRVDDTHRERCDREPVCVQPRQSRQTNLEIARPSEISDTTDGLVNTLRGGASNPDTEAKQGRNGPDFRVPGETGLSDFWDQFDIAECRAIDGSVQYRRIEPGLPPVADGLPNRVGRIRGFGNAIVPQLAATFIRAFLEAEGEG